MIIVNGMLQEVQTEGGGSDKGRPVAATETLGRGIPCNIKTIKNDRHGRTVDGIFQRTEFEVLIGADEMPVFHAERVVLTDNRKQVMGTFRVQDVQYLDTVQAILIAVAHAD